MRGRATCGFDTAIAAPNKNVTRGDVVYLVTLEVFFEHLFVDLFMFRERLRDPGVVTKDGKVYLPDLGDRA